MDLFSDLPQQKAPRIIATDGFALVPCSACKGEGRTRYTYYGGGYGAERGSERCRECKGAGKLLRRCETPVS